MKIRNIIPAMALALVACQAPKTMKNTHSMQAEILAKDIQEIKDRMALKNVVDTFSNLADEKKITEQMELFTDDAEVSSIADGKINSTYVGKKAIGEAFAKYLALFHTVYHINGQQTVEINGDTAHGISYCQVVLIGNIDGKEMQRKAGVRYSDTYVKQNGKWLIKKRVSNFMYSQVQAVQADN
jgi:bile acid 7-alpha-dehydratase